MSLQHLYTIAKSIQPFIRGENITTEGVYHIMMTNLHLSFLKELFSVENIPILVFVAYEIATGNDNPKIVDEIKNNLFYFNMFEFGDDTNDADCYQCGGEGKIDCNNCDGSGSERCNYCDGNGTDDEGETCDTCDGDGIVECEWCSGHGEDRCDDCDGRGIMSYYDEIPYELYFLVSYDKQLKTELDQSIMRNEPIYINSSREPKTLILRMISFEVGESEAAKEISKNYINDQYPGITLLPDEVTMRYVHSLVYVKQLDMKPEKYYD